MILPAFVKWSISLLVPATEVICSVNIDGSNYKEYKTGTGSPLIVSLTRSENILFWITRYNGKNFLHLLLSFVGCSSPYQQGALWCFWNFCCSLSPVTNGSLWYFCCGSHFSVIIILKIYKKFNISVAFFFFFSAGTTDVWYSDGTQPKQLWFEVQTNIIALKAYSENSQKGTPHCEFHTLGPFMLISPAASLLYFPLLLFPWSLLGETLIELKPCDTWWPVELVQAAAFLASPFYKVSYSCPNCCRTSSATRRILCIQLCLVSELYVNLVRLFSEKGGG